MITKLTNEELDTLAEWILLEQEKRAFSLPNYGGIMRGFVRNNSIALQTISAYAYLSQRCIGKVKKSIGLQYDYQKNQYVKNYAPVICNREACSVLNPKLSLPTCKSCHGIFCHQCAKMQICFKC